MKELIMIDEIFNQDIQNTAENVKSSDETVEVINEIEKIIKSKKCSILWLFYQQGQIFERFKLSDNFINMVNKFGISKYTTVFKILIVKFINKFHFLFIF